MTQQKGPQAFAVLFCCAVALKLKILFFELREILRLIPAGRPFQRVITKTPAFSVRFYKALFGAEKISVSGLTCVFAIGAEFGDIFSKQHEEPSVLFCIHYNTEISFFQRLFFKTEKKIKNRRMHPDDTA